MNSKPNKTGKHQPVSRKNGRANSRVRSVPGNKGPRREYSAGFIIFRQSPQGRVYLLLDYGKHWDYAKGHLEKGETAWVAAVRELREETGIRQVDRVPGYERTMGYQFISGVKGAVAKQVTYFLGCTRSSQVKVSDEHHGFAWLPFNQAMERLTYENARELLRAAEMHLNHHIQGTK